MKFFNVGRFLGRTGSEKPNFDSLSFQGFGEKMKQRNEGVAGSGKLKIQGLSYTMQNLF